MRFDMDIDWDNYDDSEPKVWKPSDKLSDHFTYGELTRSQTATRNGIDNTPSISELESLTELCTVVMEPIRVHFNKPVTPSSGFRCEELNKLIGGSSTSQHCKGEAIDFTVNGTDLLEVWLWIINQNKFEWDQVIYEFGSWIHISHKKWQSNRNTITIAYKEGKATKYKHFTKEQIENEEYKDFV